VRSDEGEVDGIEAEFLGDGLAVEIDGGACEGTGAEGGDIDALSGIGEAFLIASDHLDVGEKMVTDGDGLAAL